MSQLDCLCIKAASAAQGELDTVVGNAAFDTAQGTLTLDAIAANAELNVSLARALVRSLRRAALSSAVENRKQHGPSRAGRAYRLVRITENILECSPSAVVNVRCRKVALTRHSTPPTTETLCTWAGRYTSWCIICCSSWRCGADVLNRAELQDAITHFVDHGWHELHRPWRLMSSDTCSVSISIDRMRAHHTANASIGSRF